MLLNDALRILDNLNTAGDSAVEERDYVSVQLDYICPNAEGDAEILGIDLAGVTSAYQDSIDRLEDFETDVIPDIIGISLKISFLLEFLTKKTLTFIIGMFPIICRR